MNKRKYAVRIIINESGNASVTFGAEAAARMRNGRDEIYVSLKPSMGDRLAFCIWERKTGHGMVILSVTDQCQFSATEAVNVLRDFEGEYEGLIEAGNDMFFVKKDMVKPWGVVLPSRKAEMPAGRTEKPVESTDDTQANVSPLDALNALLVDLEAKMKQAEADIDEAEALRREAVDRYHACETKALAIRKAIEIMVEEG